MLMHCLIVNHAYVGDVRLQQRTASAVFLYRYTVHLPNDFNEDFVYVNFTFRRRFHKRTAPELCQRNSIVDRNFALACQVALVTDQEQWNLTRSFDTRYLLLHSSNILECLDRKST